MPEPRQRDEYGRFLPTDDVAKAAVPAAAATAEVGVSGLQVRSGIPAEEWNHRLTGDKALRLWREITDTDAIVGSMLHGISMNMRRVSWSVEPYSDLPEHQQHAEFLATCQDDMSHTWEDFVAEVCTMLPYGWAAMEIVYKVCRGHVPGQPGASSRYEDGLWRWRKLPLRAQETRKRWEWDPAGGVQAMVQRLPDGRGEAILPVEKLLLFRTTQHKGNPEGRSILRTAARAYLFKKRAEELEGIGLERDLSGIPKIGVPAKLLASNATGDEKARLQEFVEMGKRLRVDEQSAVVYPLAYDERGNKVYEVELMASPGTKAVQAGPIVERWARHMAMSVLADVVLLGHERVGSEALARTKGEMFTLTLDAWMQSIADVLNRHAVPRLFALNGWPTSELPRLVPAPVTQVDLVDLVNGVVALAGAGAGLLPNPEVEAQLAQRLGLPAEAMAAGPLGDMDRAALDNNDAEDDDAMT